MLMLRLAGVLQPLTGQYKHFLFKLEFTHFKSGGKNQKLNKLIGRKHL
jgi:hypothetical protein